VRRQHAPAGLALAVLLLVLAIVCGTIQPGQAQTLALSDRGAARTLDARALLARPDLVQLTIADPVYGRSMTYRAVPAAGLLTQSRVGPQDYVQVRAIDNFSIGVPARLLANTDPALPQAFLAIETPAASWPPLPNHADRKSAGPFYLVWRLPPGSSVSSEYWVYRVGALMVTDGPLKRWPGLGVAADVPANDPIRTGLDRYVELCIACHRFKGQGEGTQGPDLGQPMNPVQYFQTAALKKLVRDPASVRRWPDMRMPGFDAGRLSEHDLDSIIAWLAYKAARP
jgi:mono/diheme cytochrome c family protein